MNDFRNDPMQPAFPAQPDRGVRSPADTSNAHRRWLPSLLMLAIAATLGACAGPQPRTTAAASSATPICQPISDARVDRLFAQWNAALQTGDPEKVADTYARRSILLPTLSRTPRISREEKVDYFKEFLKKHPVGTINTSKKFIGCNTVVNAGTYTFRFSPTDEVVLARYTFTYGWDVEKRQWLITSHHSSAEPDGA